MWLSNYIPRFIPRRNKNTHLQKQYALIFLKSWFIIIKKYAAAKSLQSCPTLCDPIDGSPPGSPVPGILQARTLKWVAIFSAQMSINWILNEQNVIYLYNGMWFGNKEEWSTDSCYSTDKLWKHHMKSEKSITKTVCCKITFIWRVQSRQIYSDREQISGFHRREGRRIREWLLYEYGVPIPIS